MFNLPLAQSQFHPLFQFLVGGLAYLDPGSGSFILQLIIATLLGTAFIAKTYWRKIINFFRNLFSRRGGDGQE